jgi:hypothetical protein
MKIRNKKNENPTFEEWMTNKYQAMRDDELRKVLQDKINERESLDNSIGRIETELTRREMLK